MFNNKKMSTLIMLFTCILCISSAGTVNANIVTSNNNSNIILPLNDNTLIDGIVIANANPTTANVNDTISIMVIVVNNGFEDGKMY